MSPRMPDTDIGVPHAVRKSCCVQLLPGCTQACSPCFWSSSSHVQLVALRANQAAEASVCAGERRLHVAVPLIIASAALGAMGLCMQLRLPTPAFCALLVAVAIWAPDAVMASWPATFLQVGVSGSIMHDSFQRSSQFSGPPAD